MSTSNSSVQKKFGKYIIRERIGKGAFATVYRALDTVINREVALKIIKRDIVNNDLIKEVYTRFKREAEAAGNLAHQNIVSIWDYGEIDGDTFISMELVNGKDLKDYFDNAHPFEFRQIVELLSQLLDALAYSHSRGIIHRDIKPANILLNSNNTIKVTDFGIARIESSSMTKVGDVLGTPYYMSPEQIKGIYDLDNRSDLFSVGIILFQFVTGKKPFSGDSYATIIHNILNTDPEISIAEQISIQNESGLKHVIKKALAKEREDRYANAKEFKAAILKLVEQRGEYEHFNNKKEFIIHFFDKIKNSYILRKESFTLKKIFLIIFIVLLLLMVPYFLKNHFNMENPETVTSVEKNISHERKTKTILSKAKIAYTSNQIDSPPGDNAIEYITTLLEISPGNVQARRLLNDILTSYVQNGLKSLAASNIESAEKYYDQSNSLATKFQLSTVSVKELGILLEQENMKLATAS